MARLALDIKTSCLGLGNKTTCLSLGRKNNVVWVKICFVTLTLFMSREFKSLCNLTYGQQLTSFNIKFKL